MKTAIEYLEEQRNMAWHNRLCYSKNYLMEESRDGYEKEFANAARDCEIVDELIALVKETVRKPPEVINITVEVKHENEKEPPDEQTALYEVDLGKVGKLIQEIDDYFGKNSPAKMEIPTPDSSPEACAALKASLRKMIFDEGCRIPHKIEIDKG